jgi:hypothetical protein
MPKKFPVSTKSKAAFAAAKAQARQLRAARSEFTIALKALDNARNEHADRVSEAAQAVLETVPLDVLTLVCEAIDRVQGATTTLQKLHLAAEGDVDIGLGAKPRRGPRLGGNP